MMLGQPVAVIPPLLRVPGEVEGISQCEPRVAAPDDGREIEYGERNIQKIEG